jgi:hypothetical protein
LPHADASDSFYGIMLLQIPLCQIDNVCEQEHSPVALIFGLTEELVHYREEIVSNGRCNEEIKAFSLNSEEFPTVY